MSTRFVFDPSSAGRDTIQIVDPRAQMNELINHDTFFLRSDPHDEFGEPIPTYRSTGMLDCKRCRPNRIIYKWSDTPAGVSDRYDRFDPAELDWAMGTMGVPRATGRFEKHPYHEPEYS